MTIFDDMNITIERFFGPLTNWITGGTKMTEKEYNQLPAVRRSDLLLLRKSPMHLEYSKTIGAECAQPTPAQIFGAAAHKYILEWSHFEDEYAVAPNVDRRTKAGREEREDFSVRNQGKTIITSDDLDKLRAMQEAMCEHRCSDGREVKEYLRGTVETPIFWTDPETGVECKIRPDVVAVIDGRPVIVDYKTVSSCDERAFASECRKFGYKIQAGMYTEGFALTHFAEVGFAFVAQEKTPPYAVRVFNCSPDFIDQGNRQFHELLRTYKECCDSGFWPGYSDGFLDADPWEDPAEEEL